MNSQMKHEITPDDEDFLARFESGEYPTEKFRHREHLRLAYIYLTKHDPESAYKKIRSSIKNYLMHHNLDKNVYHETMTRAWILAVHHFMKKVTSSSSSDSFIDQFPVMLDSKIMLTHYSSQLLFSDQARARFVEPDLEPIPRGV